MVRFSDRFLEDLEKLANVYKSYLAENQSLTIALSKELNMEPDRSTQIEYPRRKQIKRGNTR